MYLLTVGLAEFPQHGLIEPHDVNTIVAITDAINTTANAVFLI